MIVMVKGIIYGCLTVILILSNCGLKSESVTVSDTDLVQSDSVVVQSFSIPGMRMPAPLKPGDRVMIITPSWRVEGTEVDEIKNILKQWELEPICGQYCFAEKGIMGGECWQRLHDLKKALMDSTVKAIWCSRGGYGLVQLLDSIQNDWVTRSPKWLIGYSDVTLLHMLFFKNGVASIHGVMGKQVGLAKKNPATLNYLKDILFGKRVTYSVAGDTLNRPGVAKGELFGGNLTILYSRRGTPLDLDLEGKILFIEDIGERPFEVERVMYNLKHGGVLSKLSGLIVGRFTCVMPGVSEAKTEREIYRIISEMVSEYDYPVCFNFPVGHVGENFPMLLGSQAELRIDHAGVSLMMNSALVTPVIPTRLP